MNFCFSLRSVVIVLLSICYCSSAYGESFSSLLQFTYENNKEILAARKNLKAQYQNLNQLESRLSPSLTANFSANKLWDFESDDDSDGFSADLSADYTIFDGNFTNNNVVAEEARIKSLENELDSLEQKVILSATIAYLDVLKDQRLVELSERNVVVLKQQLEATDSRFELGELTKTDVSQATAALAAASSTLSARKGSLIRSESIFEMIIGKPAEVLEKDIRLPDLPNSLAEAKETALIFNSNYKSVLFLEEMAKAKYRASKALKSPSVVLSSTLTAGESAADNSFSSFRLRVMGSVPIYSAGKNDSAIKEAEILLEMASHRSKLALLKLTQSVVTSWSDLKVVNSVIDARSRQVDANNLAFQGVREEARLGMRTTLEVLNAEQSLMNAKTELAIAESDRLAAGFSLLEAIGKLDPETLKLQVAVIKSEE